MWRMAWMIAASDWCSSIRMRIASMGMSFSVWFSASRAGSGRQHRLMLAAEAEVGLDHARIVGERVRRAFHRDLAGLEHVGVVGHLQRGARVLLDEQDPHATAAQLADDAERSE